MLSPLIPDDLHNPDLGRGSQGYVGFDCQRQVEERPGVDERVEGQGPIPGVDGVTANDVPSEDKDIFIWCQSIVRVESREVLVR